MHESTVDFQSGMMLWAAARVTLVPMLWHLEPMLWHLKPKVWHLDQLLWHLGPLLWHLEPMLWHLVARPVIVFQLRWEKCDNLKNLYVYICAIYLWYGSLTHTAIKTNCRWKSHDCGYIHHHDSFTNHSLLMGIYIITMCLSSLYGRSGDHPK